MIEEELGELKILFPDCSWRVPGGNYWGSDFARNYFRISRSTQEMEEILKNNESSLFRVFYDKKIIPRQNGEYHIFLEISVEKVTLPNKSYRYMGSIIYPLKIDYPMDDDLKEYLCEEHLYKKFLDMQPISKDI